MEVNGLNISMKATIATVIGAVVLLSSTSLVEYLDAKHVMVIQYPDGTLKAFTEPGPYGQWFGTVTKYERRAQYEFGGNAGPALKIRFNDGGHADISGAVSWEMPTTPDQLIRLQKDFASQEAIEQQLVIKALNNAVYFTGPLMSSTESSGERRSEMLQYIDDQARNGIYQTHTRQEVQKDPITNAEKTVAVVQIAKDSKGSTLRNSGSAIGDYGLSLLPPSVTEIKYDAVVEKQIAERQKSITEVQIALANSKKAEQDALTIAKQGEALAAKAKWEQETIKAKAVTEAQQKLEVAELGKKEAEAIKQREILLGQGEAERKRLVMNADGALERKLEAYVEVNKLYAASIANYKGQWVPQIVTGSGAQAGSGAQQMIDLLTTKTARDLGLDLNVPRK